MSKGQNREAVDAVLAEAARFRAGGILALINLQLEGRGIDLDGSIQFAFVFDTPHREDLGRMVRIESSWRFNPQGRDPFVDVLRHQLRELVRHEFDEGLSFDGVLVADPHSGASVKPDGVPLFVPRSIRGGRPAPFHIARIHRHDGPMPLLDLNFDRPPWDR